MIKKIFILIFVFLNGLIFPIEVDFEKSGDLHIKLESSIGKALVLKNFFMVKSGAKIMLFDKKSGKLHSTLTLKDSSFNTARAIYYGGENTFYLLSKDESKAIKIDSDQIVDSTNINSPKDWYLFIDRIFSEFYLNYRLRNSLYIFDNRSAYTKYKYRWDIFHNKKRIFLFGVDSYSTFTLPDFQLEDVKRFYGGLGYAYNIYGIIRDKFIVTSIFPPISPERPEFFSILSLEQRDRIRIDFKMLKKYLKYRWEISRICVYNENVYIFIQTQERIEVHKVILKSS